MTGTLYLVPTPLDFGCEEEAGLAALDTLLPRSTIEVAQRCQHWLTENAKSTRAFLKRVDAVAPLRHSIQDQVIIELPRQVHKKGDHASSGKNTPPYATTSASAPASTTAWQRDFLAHAQAGHDVALVSEAGMPAIADPGSSVVRAAHQLGIPVVPLSGPVSLMLALAASGLNGQSFAFRGYCTQDKEERKRQILQAQQIATQTGQTQIWIETPYRNTAFLEALLSCLAPQTHLAVCAGLTLSEPIVRSASVQTWKTKAWAAQSLFAKKPCVFLIGV